MTEPKRPLKVFLCHAHADRDPVRRLYTRLTKDGVDAWLDKEKLLPGQDWELEIKRAVREADVVVVCLSKQFNQAGFRQKEVRLALDTAMEQPEGEIFIIPARLEECDAPENMYRYHWVDLFEKGGYEKLLQAFRVRAEKISVAFPPKLSKGGLSWEKRVSKPNSRLDKQQKSDWGNKPFIVVIGLIASIIAIVTFISGAQNVFELFPTKSPTPTFGPTPTFTLHPDAIGPIQTLMALAGTVNAIEQSSVTQPIQQTLTSVASTIELLGQTATKAAETPTPVVIPSPNVYSQPLSVFDQYQNTSNKCWLNDANETNDGFYKRVDGNWAFRIDKSQSADQYVQTDFSNCVDSQDINAIALNIWVARLELERNSFSLPSVVEPGKEIGLFVEDVNAQRSTYTIWVDKDELMHLRVRQNTQIVFDDVIFIVNHSAIKIEGMFPSLYSTFPIQIFFELNNNGLDILYLAQGPFLRSVNVEDINPSRMIRIDSAVLPALSDIKKIGLIGYGGNTQIIVWPLIFFGD